MSAFTPTGFRAVALLGALAVAVLGAGLALGRVRVAGAPRALAWGRAAAWALAASAAAAANGLSAAEPAGVRMLAIIGCTLLGMKAVVVVEARAAGLPPLAPWRWLAFAALWLGMDPRPFAAPRAAPFADARALLLRGAAWLAAGALAVAAARFVWLRTGSRAAATALLLPGLSLVLHFGACNLLAGGWRAAGIGVRPLFRAPLLAHSLGEFWGRRWNLAFSEMAAAAVYRPLAARRGRAAGVAAAFALSGALHELAISVPVRAGIGLPFLYFALHGGLVLLEDVLARRGVRLAGAAARAWTLAWLALPLLALFHPWFLRGVVWPLAGVGE